MRVGSPERIDVKALNITTDKVAVRRRNELAEEAATELRRMLDELATNTQMQKTRKAQMKGFLKRHSARILEKRARRLSAEPPTTPS